MPIASEDRLRAALAETYVIRHELGEGGMATVYLADDPKHERRVALKVLKPELAAVVGGDRFLAEIKTTANLQHPHILPLYDSGAADGFLYYVMPYVEGETLRDKLDRERQLPVDEAVLIASDIAEALDYAHRHGVIHRDIKPANILMVEGRPLVADFGIALAVGSAGGARLTETGLSVGTPFYMSPEQATGDQVISHGSDIYALGCVLYEMLVGEPPFVGATAQAVLGKIIQGGRVSASDHRKSIPPHVDAAVRKAVEKLPADRFASAAGFAGALRDRAFRYGAVAGEAGPRRSWTRATSGIASVSLLAVGGMGWAMTRPLPGPPVERYAFQTLVPEHFPLSPIDVGPEGTGFVFYGRNETGGGFQLWYRRFDGLEAVPVAQSAGGADPAISPDGTEVAFAAGTELRIVPLAGGVARTVADSVFCCATWGGDGFVYYTKGTGTVLARAPVGGGASEVVFDAAGDGVPGFLYPLPGGKSAVVTLFGDPIRVEAVDLESGERTFLTEGAKGTFASSGHLLFVSANGALLAAPFDPREPALTGPAVPILDRVFVAGGGVPIFSINEQGTLAYWEGEGGAGTQLVWITREGAVSTIDPDWTFDPGPGNRGWALSPDGRYVAVRMAADGGSDIWVKELDEGPSTRLTFWGGEDRDPNWLADSRTITFLSDMPVEGEGGDAADLNLWRQVADGSRPAELVYDHAVPIAEAEVSPDGGRAVLRSAGVAGVSGGRDVYSVQLDGEREARPILATPFDESAPKISPDGRWLAYQSNESGRDEVYVRPYPATEGSRIQVSASGGLAPRWARDGSELYYLTPGREMMAAAVSMAGSGFRVTGRSLLFTLPSGVIVGDRTTQYDVAADGRFLMLTTATGDEETSRLIVVRNFLEEVKARMGGS